MLWGSPGIGFGNISHVKAGVIAIQKLISYLAMVSKSVCGLKYNDENPSKIEIQI